MFITKKKKKNVVSLSSSASEREGSSTPAPGPGDVRADPHCTPLCGGHCVTCKSYLPPSMHSCLGCCLGTGQGEATSSQVRCTGADWCHVTPESYFTCLGLAPPLTITGPTSQGCVRSGCHVCEMFSTVSGL